MLALQNTSLDSAMFYDARCAISDYSGMFHPMERKPYPAYYGFMAFSELYRRRNQVDVEMNIPGVYACAAKDDSTGCIVIANTTDESVEVFAEVLGGKVATKCMQICEGCIWEEREFLNELPKYSVVYIEFA